MKTIWLNELTEGMKFTQEVYANDDLLFLAENVPVRKKDIERMKKLGINAVKTKGEIIQTIPNTEENQEILSFQNPEITEAVSFYHTTVLKVTEVFQKILEKKAIDNYEITQIAEAIAAKMKQSPHDLVTAILRGENTAKTLAKSAVHCAALSLLIAAQLGVEGKNLIGITIGALLHDCGMLRIPQSLLQKSGDLSEADQKIIKAHPVHSYSIIAKELKYPDSIGQIGLQHQERWNGEGYPRGLSQKAISLPTRIVSVADAFEAMISEKPYRSSVIGYTAVKNILNDNGRHFDPSVVQALVKGIGIYPIGSIVFLNNSIYAQVINVHAQAPLRPKLRAIIDADGSKYLENKGPVIDLLTEKHLFIVKAINAKELNSQWEA